MTYCEGRNYGPICWVLRAVKGLLFKDCRRLYNIIQYNTIQLDCLRGEIPFAAIKTRRNIKHHINMTYWRVLKNKSKKQKKKNVHTERACQDWNMLKSLGNSMLTYTHMSIIPTLTHTPPSPAPTNTITYWIHKRTVHKFTKKMKELHP